MCIRDRYGDDWTAFYSWCKKSDAWNAFEKNGTSCPSLTITSSQQAFLYSYRAQGNYMVREYCQLFLQLHRLEPNFFDTDFDNALDDVRVQMWRLKDKTNSVWKGLDAPGQNGYKLTYQYFCFVPLAYQLLIERPTPFTPELTANEKKALKAFAGGLEVTQEFVPDSWLSPDIQIETKHHDGGDKSCQCKMKRRKTRSLGGTVLEVVKRGLPMGRERV